LRIIVCEVAFLESSFTHWDWVFLGHPCFPVQGIFMLVIMLMQAEEGGFILHYVHKLPLSDTVVLKKILFHIRKCKNYFSYYGPNINHPLPSPFHDYEN
jgi:hypothetical protein